MYSVPRLFSDHHPRGFEAKAHPCKLDSVEFCCCICIWSMAFFHRLELGIKGVQEFCFCSVFLVLVPIFVLELFSSFGSPRGFEANSSSLWIALDWIGVDLLSFVFFCCE